MFANGWRYGLVKADHYRPIKDQNLIQPLLTIPLVTNCAVLKEKNMKVILSIIIALCLLTGFVATLMKVFSDIDFSLRTLFGGLFIVLVITFIFRLIYDKDKW